LSVGTHTISFRVRDNDGEWSSTDTQPLTINNVKASAHIDLISPNSTTEGENVRFKGSGSEVRGTIQAYKWESSIDGEFSNLEDFNYNSLSPGNHIIYFSVQDDEGQWSTSVTEVLFINRKPTATIVSITPETGIVGQTIEFIGDGFDDDGTIENYTWEIQSSTDVYHFHLQSFSFSDFPEGIYTINFKVSDDHDEWSNVTSLFLKIKSENTPPVINLNAPTDGTTIITVQPTLQWSAEDVDQGDTLTFAIFMDTNENPSTQVLENATTKSFSTENLTEGVTYYWKVVADDGIDQTTSEIWAFYVNKKPVASIIAESTSFREGEKISFDASGSTDEDGTLIAYNFIFGDGSNTGWIETPIVEHVFTSVGNYIVEVQVRDNTSAASTNSAKWSIQVIAQPPDNSDDDGNDIMGFSPVVIIGFLILIVIIGIFGVSHVMTRNLLNLKRKGGGKNGNS